MVTLIGTGHVFDIGDRVREEIRLRSPVVVGIELDAPRYRALRANHRDTSKAPFFYRLLANFQTRIADAYGVEAGAEMLAAADEAAQLGVPLALIDADAQQTFKKLLKELTFWERMKLGGSIVAGVFVPAKSVEKQVDEMQEDYSSYFHQMGQQFPTLKRILLDDRNVHMARALVELHARGGEVVAVMGDGHVDGVEVILRNQGIEVNTIRLKELRQPSTRSPADAAAAVAPAAATPEGNASATLSMDISADSPPPRE